MNDAHLRAYGDVMRVRSWRDRALDVVAQVVALQEAAARVLPSEQHEYAHRECDELRRRLRDLDDIGHDAEMGIWAAFAAEQLAELEPAVDERKACLNEVRVNAAIYCCSLAPGHVGKHAFVSATGNLLASWSEGLTDFRLSRPIVDPCSCSPGFQSDPDCPQHGQPALIAV